MKIKDMCLNFLNTKTKKIIAAICVFAIIIAGIAGGNMF